ncbi:MAG: sensor domain-containing diguanylate cyclase [Spirochaetes bacterium]|nr:sensor domain-containing diguanylate cyclase [Spirochaetota bacterium]
MKRGFSLLYILLFSLALGLALWGAHRFIQGRLLSGLEKKLGPSLGELNRLYRGLETLPAVQVLPALKAANRQYLRLHREPGREFAWLINYGPEGAPLAVHATLPGQGLLNQIHREQALRPPRDLAWMSASAGVPVLRITHANPRSGVFSTVLGVKDASFLRRRQWVSGSLLAFWGLGVALFSFLMFLGGNRQPAHDHTLREGFPRENPSGRAPFTHDDVAPMERSPFARPTEKPAGSRFFKEEYLAKVSESPEPTKLDPLPPPPPPQAPAPEKERPFEEVQAWKTRMESQVDELAMLREVSLASSSISDLGEFIGTVLTLLRSRYPVDRIEFFQVDPADARTLHRRARIEDYKVFHDPALDGREEHRILLDLGEEGGALARNVAIALAKDGRSLLTAPLVDKGALIGALRLSHGQADFFGENDRFILAKLARHVAVSLNNVRLYDTAVRDGLTGLYGHKHFQAVLSDELKKAERYKDNLALAIFDLDHFKRVNDTWGHPAGDAVIRAFAKILTATVRGSDAAFRYGGEEFAVIFLRADPAGARETCERIRLAVEKCVIEHGGHRIPVTVSVGLSSLDFRPLPKEAFIQEADRALYAAKEKGRNQVRRFDEA